MTKTNAWLCRNFDTEKKGYVTAGDIVSIGGGTLLLISVVAAVIATVIYSVYQFFILGGFSSTTEPTLWSYQTFGGVVVLVVALGIAMLILVLIVTFLEYFWNIKIAKCELKEDK